MTSEYEEIYSRFLLRVTDYKFAGLEEKIANEMMNSWLRSTLSKPYIRRLFSSVTIDDDVESIDYELSVSVDNDSDKDFIEEVLAMGMTVEWLLPQYYSVLNTSQFFSNSEQKWYSQANHMTELREMLKNAQNDLRKMIRDRGYINNSYISES